MRGESGVVVGPPLGIVNQKYRNLSPRLGLDYQVTPEFLAYAYVASGFKSGGFNGRSTDLNLGAAFKPEKVVTYEAGIKSDWFNRRLRLNAAAFYNDYSDIQVQVLLAAATGLSPLTTNGAKARTYGGEAEIQAKVTRDFDLGVSLGYVNARFTKLSPGAVAAGLSTMSRFQRVPEFTLGAYAQYRVPLGDQDGLVGRLDFAYRSTVYNDVANTPVVAQPGYGLLSARLAYEFGGNWEVAVYGANLTNKYYITGGLNLLPSGFGFYNVQRGGLPRTFGGSVRLKF